jgi:hypothetical protein
VLPKLKERERERIKEMASPGQNREVKDRGEIVHEKVFKLRNFLRTKDMKIQ